MKYHWRIASHLGRYILDDDQDAKKKMSTWTANLEALPRSLKKVVRYFKKT
jgi:hypothetical protein